LIRRQGRQWQRKKEITSRAFTAARFAAPGTLRWIISRFRNVLVVNSALPVKNLKEFLEYVRKNPGRLSYGSAGQGSLTHLTMELFKQQMGSFMVHIPYRGIAPAFNDLIGGQTQAMFPGLAAAMPHIRSGRVRPIAITGQSRHPLLKETPTLDESGFKGFEAQQWYGVVGPAGLPSDVVKTLSDTLTLTLQSPDMADKLSIEAIEPRAMSPDAFGKFIKADIARWTQLAKDRNIQLES
jgi:tripartite-type tricarboxylate transporter receptor subunit TctC